MEKKINLIKLLKDSPKGMELDCTMYDNVTLDSVSDGSDYPIKITTKNWFSTRLTKYGQNINIEDAKCVIFPKGKTTWEGFVPPCQFNDGDVIFTHTNALKCNLDNNWVSIFKEYRNNRCACYVCLCLSDLELYHDKWENELLCELCDIEESRLSTEEEKQILFDAIKANGYKWNNKTKTLEKLIKPKFDITTFKPFDKVLVRDNDEQLWVADFFGFHGKTIYPFACVSHYANQCIPYEGNEHLLGTTDECDEFYKMW